MSDDLPPGEEPRTVFMPGASVPPPPPPPPTPEIPPAAAREPTTAGFSTQFAPREVGQGIQVGDVLNHIFEVKRYIARGGMGEVFEGVNVNTDERVAIKVMLPSLAADPNVIAMFRKEARTLTRLQHEALVQYRVLAQEPQLGVLYIVTEYVDGVNLADDLGRQRPTAADLFQLLRRLASGLRVAHQLGAIHRDMSPDNVLLEDGELGKAKIIDFGIAKDLDPGSKTIVGEGFAGKLNYVAPEQLGDFGREIGAWTDVYSLALVILAVALGKNVQMGGSLVDAVDKRRAGPDLSGAPEELRPVLGRMLAPNPAQRLRSMDEVLLELEPKLAAVEPPAKPKTGLLIGAGVGVVALAAAGFLLFGRGGDAPAGGGVPVAAVSQDPVEVARAAIDSTLPSVSCTWLNIGSIGRTGKRIDVVMTGVAGNPAAAQSEISRALAAQKVTDANIDFEGVSPITQSGCAALDTYRQVRLPTGRRLTSPQSKYEMRMQPNDATSVYPGENAASVPIRVNIGDSKLDFALIGIEPSGVIDPQFLPGGKGVTGRPELEALAKSNPQTVTKAANDAYQLLLGVNHSDWSGVLLLTGKGPFPKDLVAPDFGSRGPDWRNRFVTTAAEKGWQADMIWFKTIDEVKE